MKKLRNGLLGGLLLYTVILSATGCAAVIPTSESSSAEASSAASSASSNTLPASASTQSGPETPHAMFPTPVYDENGPLWVPIASATPRIGGGTLISGVITRGTIQVGDTVQIIGLGQETIEAQVSSILDYESKVEKSSAKIKEKVFLTLPEVDAKTVQQGQSIIKPDSMSARSTITADLYMLTAEEGGFSAPFSTSNKLKFYFGDLSLVGQITLPDSGDTIVPGTTVSASITLESPLPTEKNVLFTAQVGEKEIFRGSVADTAT